MSANETGTKRRKGKRGHGEGTIGQRPDGRWYAQVMVGYKPDGKPDRRTVYGKTRGECQKKLDDLRKRASGGLLPERDKDGDSLSGFLDRWLEATKSSVRARTFERYAEIVRIHLKPGLGRHRLDALKPDHVQLFYSQKLVDGREREDGKPATGLSAQTVVHIHRVLHRALGQAVRWGYVVRNVTDMVDPPRVPRREMVVPIPEEVGRLLDAADAGGDRLAGLWATAALTGARQGELLGLQWGDVDLDAGTLQVRRSLRRARGGVPDYDEAKTTRSRRVVILTADAVAELRSHQDRQAFERQKLGEHYASHNLVFATPLGTPLDASNVGHRFKDAAKRANLRPEIRFHDLRHFAISAMLAAGIDVPAVSESVGHHSPAMTLGVYGHVMPGSKRKAAEKLSEVIRSARRGASG